MNELKLHNSDRLLPSQPVMQTLYLGDNYFEDLGSLMAGISGIKSVHDKFVINLPEGRTYASLGSEISTLCFYQMLIKMGKYERILELGTFIGVSTMFLAEATLGKVTTVEIGQEFHEIACLNIALNVLRNIKPIHADADSFLKEAVKNFMRYDFILMDAAKEKYGDMLENSLTCLMKGGLLVVDDIFMQGDTLNTDKGSKGKGVQELLDKVDTLNRTDYPRVLLPIGNGILLIFKRTS